MGIQIGVHPAREAHCGGEVLAMYWNGEQVFPNVLPESEWLYTVENGTATLLLYRGNAKTLTIPSRIGGAVVTGLEATACSHAAIEQVKLPAGITLLA